MFRIGYTIAWASKIKKQVDLQTKPYPLGAHGKSVNTDRWSIVYHLVDMITSILLVESQVILNGITGFIV